MTNAIETATSLYLIYADREHDAIEVTPKGALNHALDLQDMGCDVAIVVVSGPSQAAWELAETVSDMRTIPSPAKLRTMSAVDVCNLKRITVRQLLCDLIQF